MVGGGVGFKHSELHRSVFLATFQKTPPQTRRLFQHVEVRGSM